MPTDEENLIRYCTLGRAEMDLIQAKRTPHNRLGLAIQLCFLRHLGRAILPGETPPAPMVAFLAHRLISTRVPWPSMAGATRPGASMRSKRSGISVCTHPFVRTDGRP